MAGAQTAKSASGVGLRRALMQFEKDLRGAGRRPTVAEMAEEAGLGTTTYTNARAGLRAVASPETWIRLANLYRVPLASFLERGTPRLLLENGDLRFALTGSSTDADHQALRLAAAGVVTSRPPAEIEDRIHRLRESRGLPRLRFDEDRLRALAQGGLELGMVEAVLSEDGDELLHPRLGGQLAEALARILPERPPTVRVVRNVAHPGFSIDPAAPFLVGLAAHRVLRDFLARVPSVYCIGLSGGAHCAAFVQGIGRGSSPFPGTLGDKKLTFVPLTLEPFRDHAMPLSDSVVGEMNRKAGRLLGPRQVEARTFQCFGTLEDSHLARVEHDAIAMVREEYHKLDVAIFGCGDQVPGGWLDRVRRNVGFDSDRGEPATDVCLNLLNADGEPIPLRNGRSFVGVALPDIRHVASIRDALALLITSGPSKGEALGAVARAGCFNAVVCDEAAADAALKALAREGS